MKCAHCGGLSFVADSRPQAEEIFRRRKCRVCGHRWSTYEVSRERLDRKAQHTADRIIARERAAWVESAIAAVRNSIADEVIR